MKAPWEKQKKKRLSLLVFVPLRPLLTEVTYRHISEQPQRTNGHGVPFHHQVPAGKNCITAAVSTDKNWTMEALHVVRATMY